MEILYFALLVVLAFWLGACPFAVWVGKWLLGKDIRKYGDHNPGSYNVLRAGGRWIFALTLILEMAKGIPFVALAHYYFGLPEAMVMGVGLSAILGHAFSPILKFNGGKALAVTGGVLLAMPQHEMFIAVVIFMLLAYLFIDIDAWRVTLAMTATLIYLLITKGFSLEPLFIVCIMAILTLKHFEDLSTTRPKLRGKLIRWLHDRRAAHAGRQ
ncbi:MAG TPA: glycerol-3-phosphate acyltransferase [Dehalococcoidia bacterium]